MRVACRSRPDGVRPVSFDEFLADTSTDGIVVARGGRIVLPKRRRANGTAVTATDRNCSALASTDNTLFVDAKRQLVIDKVSSEELPLAAARIISTLRAISAVRRALAG